MRDNPVPNGNSFRSFVRVLDKSIGADEAPRGGFSPCCVLVRPFSHGLHVLRPTLPTILLNMQFWHAIFAAAVLHSLYHLTASWRHKKLVAKLKLAFYAAIIRVQSVFCAARPQPRLLCAHR